MSSLPHQPPLLLTDLIRQVRQELTTAFEEHKQSGQPSIFTVESVALEVNVTVQRDETLKAGGGAKLVVVDLEAGGEKTLSASHVHKVTVQLSVHAPRPAIDPGEPVLLKPPGKKTGGNKISLQYPFNLQPVDLTGLPTKLKLSPKQQTAFHGLFKGKQFTTCFVPKTIRLPEG